MGGADTAAGALGAGAERCWGRGKRAGAPDARQRVVLRARVAQVSLPHRASQTRGRARLAWRRTPRFVRAQSALVVACGLARWLPQPQGARVRVAAASRRGRGRGGAAAAAGGAGAVAAGAAGGAGAVAAAAAGGAGAVAAAAAGGAGAVAAGGAVMAGALTAGGLGGGGSGSRGRLRSVTGFPGAVLEKTPGRLRPRPGRRTQVMTARFAATRTAPATIQGQRRRGAWWGGWTRSRRGLVVRRLASSDFRSASRM